MTVQAAFAADYTSEPVARQVERLSGLLRNEAAMLAEYEETVVAVADPAQKVALLQHLARWDEAFLDDAAAAERKPAALAYSSSTGGGRAQGPPRLRATGGVVAHRAPAGRHRHARRAHDRAGRAAAGGGRD